MWSLHWLVLCNLAIFRPDKDSLINKTESFSVGLNTWPWRQNWKTHEISWSTLMLTSLTGKEAKNERIKLLKNSSAFFFFLSELERNWFGSSLRQVIAVVRPCSFWVNGFSLPLLVWSFLENFVFMVTPNTNRKSNFKKLGGVVYINVI